MNVYYNGRENTVGIFRKRPIPHVFTAVPFVRLDRGGFVDSPEDARLLELFRDIVNGKRCVSELDTSYRLVMKIEISPDVVDRTGVTNDPVDWWYFYWKRHDASHVFEPGKPRPFEAVSVKDAGLGCMFSL